jgi:hypothetical protein
MKFWFHPYKELPKWTPYATGASILVCAAPGLRTGLELEILWASTRDENGIGYEQILRI